MAESGWSSLEAAKLAVSAVTPIAVLFLTVAVNKLAKRAEAAREKQARVLEEAQWANRRTVELLIELHNRMAPLLNDILCFFTWVGDFRSIDPPTALRKKRELDKIYFANRHLFENEFRERYSAFIALCFSHWGRAGEDAMLRTSAETLRLERGPHYKWDANWSGLFADEPEEPRELAADQRSGYEATMDAFAAQLGLGRRNPQRGTHDRTVVSEGSRSIEPR